MNLNRGQIRYSIQAVLNVVSALVCVWKRGGRCFAGRFTLGLDDDPAGFGRNDDLGINLQEIDTRVAYAVRIAVNHFSPQRLVQNIMP